MPKDIKSVSSIDRPGSESSGLVVLRVFDTFPYRHRAWRFVTYRDFAFTKPSLNQRNKIELHLYNTIVVFALDKMVAIGAATFKAEQEVAQAEAPELQRVKWWSDPGLRRLYFWAAVLCVASATSGYDGLWSQICLSKSLADDGS